jgi:dynamin GTPase
MMYGVPQVNVSECVVEDLDASGNPRAPASSEKPSLMLRVRHRDPRQTAVKDHTALVLRAESMEQKAQWLGRLRRASEPRRAKVCVWGRGGRVATQGEGV